MTARAIVRASHPDGTVDVEIDTSERCEGCAGVCLWRRMPERERVRMAGLRGLEPGTNVRVALPARYVLVGSLLLHGLPLAALLLGALAGAFVTGNDVGALAGAAIGAGIVLKSGRQLRGRLERTLLGELRLERCP